MHPKEWNVTSSLFSYKPHHSSKKVIWSTHPPNTVQTVHISELIPYTALLIQPLSASVSQVGLSLNKPSARSQWVSLKPCLPWLIYKGSSPNKCLSSLVYPSCQYPIPYHTQANARTLLQITTNNIHGTSSIINVI